MVVVKRTALLAILSLLPSGAFCASTSMPSTPAQEVMKFYAELNQNEWSYGLNQLLADGQSINPNGQEIAFVGGQYMSTGPCLEISTIPSTGAPTVPNDLDESSFFATIHCTVLEATIVSEDRKLVAQSTDEISRDSQKQTCNVDICQGRNENDELNCIHMRFLDYSTYFQAPIQVTTGRRLEPAREIMVTGTVTGGTGMYSGIMGGEARVYDGGSSQPVAGYGGNHFFEVALISYPSPVPAPIESISNGGTSSGVSNGETIQETFIAIPIEEKIYESFGIGNITNGLIARAGEKRIVNWDIVTSSDCNSAGDCEGLLGNPENFMTSFFIADFSRVALKLDICYGKNEENEPNCIFLKGNGENADFTFSVMGGTGIYRSKGGQARSTNEQIFGQDAYKIEVELIPYSGENLWDE